MTGVLQDAITHYVWLLDYYCVKHNLYNTTTCQEKYTELPACIEKIEIAYANPTLQNRVDAHHLCGNMANGDMHGIVREDIRITVNVQSQCPLTC